MSGLNDCICECFNPSFIHYIVTYFDYMFVTVKLVKERLM